MVKPIFGSFSISLIHFHEGKELPLNVRQQGIQVQPAQQTHRSYWSIMEGSLPAHAQNNVSKLAVPCQCPKPTWFLVTVVTRTLFPEWRIDVVAVFGCQNSLRRIVPWSTHQRQNSPEEGQVPAQFLPQHRAHSHRYNKLRKCRVTKEDALGWL